ncbi:hypothetical protein ElyMa_003077600, partial [Elysia marginata]
VYDIKYVSATPQGAVLSLCHRDTQRFKMGRGTSSSGQNKGCWWITLSKAEHHGSTDSVQFMSRFGSPHNTKYAVSTAWIEDSGMASGESPSLHVILGNSFCCRPKTRPDTQPLSSDTSRQHMFKVGCPQSPRIPATTGRNSWTDIINPLKRCLN